MNGVPVFLILLASSFALAQHEHHNVADHRHQVSPARLEVSDDSAAQSLTVRLGPLNLPAHATHMQVAQPADQFFPIPFDGWLLAYHPRLVDQAGNSLPGRMLHHVAYWNTNRSDFLCPNHQEHIFGAGSEMNDWQSVPGFGYRVHPQDRIRVSSMFHNPTDTGYTNAYLEVRIEYRLAGKDRLKSVYPAWFDVQQCGESDYDLEPGRNITSGTLKLDYSGVLLGVGGHMHDYGRELALENVTRKENIATLDASLDAKGRLLSIPIVYFVQQGGYHLNKDDVVKVTATYDNQSGKQVPQGAMGMVVGYFLPDNDSEMWQQLVQATP
ncbi:MAG TPA: hypothetical protein VEV41_09700 [Terriglobales bacterium]|nr:hypothetical protein [Terriglobales bacterium]